MGEHPPKHSQDGLCHWSRLLKAPNNVRIDSTQKANLSQLTLRFTNHGLHDHSPSNCTMQHSATHNSDNTPFEARCPPLLTVSLSPHQMLPTLHPLPYAD